MKELFTGIYGKFAETTGGLHNDLYTALSGRLYNTFAPQGSTYPYAVFSLVSGSHDWTFTEDYEGALIQFAIFDNSSSADTVCTIYNKLNTLFDNCTLTMTGYTHIYFWRDFNQLLRDEEEGTWQYLVQYRAYQQEQ